MRVFKRVFFIKIAFDHKQRLLERYYIAVLNVIIVCNIMGPIDIFKAFYSFFIHR